MSFFSIKFVFVVLLRKVTVESDLLTKWRELSEQVGQQYEELREQATIVDHVSEINKTVGQSDMRDSVTSYRLDNNMLFKLFSQYHYSRVVMNKDLLSFLSCK